MSSKFEAFIQQLASSAGSIDGLSSSPPTSSQSATMTASENPRDVDTQQHKTTQSSYPSREEIARKQLYKRWIKLRKRLKCALVGLNVRAHPPQCILSHASNDMLSLADDRCQSIFHQCWLSIVACNACK